MATRKRSGAKPTKKSRSGRKIAPVSSSPSSPKKRKKTPKKALRATTRRARPREKKPASKKRAKKVIKKKPARQPKLATTKKRKKRSVAAPTKRTKRTKRVAPIKLRKPAKKKAAPTKKKPAKKKAAPTKKKPAKKKAAPVKKKPAKKKAAPVKKKPPTKRKKIDVPLTDEQRKALLERAAKNFSKVPPHPIATWGGSRGYGIYATLPFNFVLDEDTVDTVRDRMNEAAQEVHDILVARFGPNKRVLLWSTFDILRFATYREGYSEQEIRTVEDEDIGRYWTGHGGCRIERYDTALARKLGEMMSEPTYLMAGFVYGVWKRPGKRRIKRRR